MCNNKKKEIIRDFITPVLPDPNIVSVMQSKQGVDVSVTPSKERNTRK